MANVIKKERMVTRTIIKNTASVTGYNWDEMKVETRTKTLTGKLDKFADNLFIMQQFASAQFAPHHIEEMTSKEVRYGMSESDFIKYGHVLTAEEEEAEEE